MFSAKCWPFSSGNNILRKACECLKLFQWVNSYINLSVAHFISEFSIQIKIWQKLYFDIIPELNTWHNSCAVITCTKICSDEKGSNDNRVAKIFLRIWIMIEKLLMEWTSGYSPFSLVWKSPIQIMKYQGLKSKTVASPVL